MAVLRFTTSRLSELRAAGRLDELQHATIAPFLERELGPKYGRLFADFEAESRDVRAWYADVDTAPRPIDALSEPEQEALRQQVADMIGKITEFATRMAAESTQKANLARILTAATTFPIEDLWLAGDQPLIVNWGFHRQNVQAGVPRPIQERINRPVVTGVQPSKGGGAPPVPSQTVVVAPRPASTFRPWVVLPALLWVLFAALVAVNYRLLLPACGLHGPLGSFSLFDACDVTATSEGLASEGAELQRQIDQAELELRRQKTLCPPEPPPQRRAEAEPRPAPKPPVTPPRPPEPPRPVPVPPPVKAIKQQVEQAMPRDAPRGKVEVSLKWNNVADLDLIIVCPDGNKLWRKELQACGGQMLKDVIPSSTNPTETHIEHAAWAVSPGGRFKITVELYNYSSVPSGTDIPFQVLITRGDQVQLIEGHIKGAHTVVTAATADL